MIPQRTRERLRLYSSGEAAAVRQALLEWMTEDQLPVEYGGNASLDDLPLETEMLEYVQALNRGGPIPPLPSHATG